MTPLSRSPEDHRPCLQIRAATSSQAGPWPPATPEHQPRPNRFHRGTTSRLLAAPPVPWAWRAAPHPVDQPLQVADLMQKPDKLATARCCSRGTCPPHPAAPPTEPRPAGDTPAIFSAAFHPWASVRSMTESSEPAPSRRLLWKSSRLRRVWDRAACTSRWNRCAARSLGELSANSLEGIENRAPPARQAVCRAAQSRPESRPGSAPAARPWRGHFETVIGHARQVGAVGQRDAPFGPAAGSSTSRGLRRDSSSSTATGVSARPSPGSSCVAANSPVVMST